MIGFSSRLACPLLQFVFARQQVERSLEQALEILDPPAQLSYQSRSQKARGSHKRAGATTAPAVHRRQVADTWASRLQSALSSPPRSFRTVRSPPPLECIVSMPTVVCDHRALTLIYSTEVRFMSGIFLMQDNFTRIHTLAIPR